MNRRIFAGLLTVASLAFALLACKYGSEPTEAQDTKPAAADQPVVMPATLSGLLITLGLKDEAASEWDGKITVSAGKIVAMDISEGKAKKSTVKGGNFTVKTTVTKKDQKKGNVNHPALRVTLDAPATAQIKITTKKGDFEFALGDLPAPGSSKNFLNNQVSVAREDGALRLTSGDTEHDYPAMAKAADGTLWLAYCDYTKGKPYITERVLLGDFDSLVPKGNGDQIRLKSYNGTTWSAAVDVTGAGLDIWRPTVTVAGGRVHVSWSQQVDGNWDIYHRVYTPPAKAGEQGKWSPVIRVTDHAGTDYNVVSTTSSTGQVWLAWQGRRGGRFQILAGKVGVTGDEKKAGLTSPEIQVTGATADHWNPSIAADSSGKVYVGYDGYEKGNFDVQVAEISGAAPQIFDIANSAKFEARCNLVCDKNDRLWVAYEEGDEQWGKDYSNTTEYKKIGLESNPGNGLYVKRTVRVSCLVNGKVMRPAGDLQTALAQKSAANKSVPRLAFDGAGGLWLAYRHHPKPFGQGEVWNSFVLRYNGKEWSTPRRLGYSANLMDNHPALVPFGQGLMIAFSGDGRISQTTRKQDHLYAALLSPSGASVPTELVAVPPAEPAKLATVHPNETSDIARIREYRFDHEGKKLHLIRGEFHRHTEYTAHRDGDGLLEDAWRYALDAGNLDWMGDGDHDNGHHDEYSWWQIQKLADIINNGTSFVAVHSYERSVKYPDGHRNIIFPKRGIRPLPRGSFKGSEEKGTPDTFVLYKYLHHFKAMCSSHTSATSMGTDWRNNDPVVEPVVEIYQGHRHNYEFIGARRDRHQRKPRISGAGSPRAS